MTTDKAVSSVRRGRWASPVRPARIRRDRRNRIYIVRSTLFANCRITCLGILMWRQRNRSLPRYTNSWKSFMCTRYALRCSPFFLMESRIRTWSEFVELSEVTCSGIFVTSRRREEGSSNSRDTWIHGSLLKISESMIHFRVSTRFRFSGIVSAKFWKDGRRGDIRGKTENS